MNERQFVDAICLRILEHLIITATSNFLESWKFNQANYQKKLSKIAGIPGVLLKIKTFAKLKSQNLATYRLDKLT